MYISECVWVSVCAGRGGEGVGGPVLMTATRLLMEQACAPYTGQPLNPTCSRGGRGCSGWRGARVAGSIQAVGAAAPTFHVPTTLPLPPCSQCPTSIPGLSLSRPLSSHYKTLPLANGAGWLGPCSGPARRARCAAIPRGPPPLCVCERVRTCARGRLAGSM